VEDGDVEWWLSDALASSARSEGVTQARKYERGLVVDLLGLWPCPLREYDEGLRSFGCNLRQDSSEGARIERRVHPQGAA